MKVATHHYLLAHTSAFSMALGGGAGIALALLAFRDAGALVADLQVWMWILVAAGLAGTVGLILGGVFIWGVLSHLVARMQGWPFKVGDEVVILKGKHKNTVVTIYEVWEPRGQVRVDLGEAMKESVKDVFCVVEVCRHRRQAPDPDAGTSPSRARRLAAAGMLLGVVALWGWTFVVVKDAIAVYGVLPFLAVRFAIGAACLGAVCFRRVDRRTFGAGAAIGLVLGAAFLLQTLGLNRASASITGLITGLFVLFTPLANRVLFGVRTPRSLWAAIGASLLGLALLTGAAPGGWGAGEALATGGAALFGLHVALLDRWAAGRNATVLAFGQLSGAAALFAVLCAASGALPLPPPGVWPALLITGIGASAVAYLVQTHVQQRLSAVQTALILLSETLFAVLFGCWLHGDRMTPPQIAGGILMVAMMALAELRRPSGGGRVQEDAGPK